MPQRVLDPREFKFKRRVREFCKEAGVPGGPNGLVAICVSVPLVVYIAVKTLGLITALFYSIPLGIIGAILYAEADLAYITEDKDA